MLGAILRFGGKKMNGEERTKNETERLETRWISSEFGRRKMKENKREKSRKRVESEHERNDDGKRGNEN